MFLLDTNVISELRRAKPHGAVLAWFDAVRPEEIAIPAVVIGEIQDGAEITRRISASMKSPPREWLSSANASQTIRVLSAEFQFIRTGPIRRESPRRIRESRNKPNR